MTYNPADYNAVLSDAKGMPKEELEKYYVDKKSKGQINCCEVITMIIIGAILIVGIGAIGYSIGQEDIRQDIRENINVIEKDICHRIYGDYESQEFYKSIVDSNKIICN